MKKLNCWWGKMRGHDFGWLRWQLYFFWSVQPLALKFRAVVGTVKIFLLWGCWGCSGSKGSSACDIRDYVSQSLTIHKAVSGKSPWTLTDLLLSVVYNADAWFLSFFFFTHILMDILTSYWEEVCEVLWICYHINLKVCKVIWFYYQERSVEQNN